MALDRRGEPRNKHLENGVLLLQGAAASQKIKHYVWNQIKLVDPNYPDLTCDLTVDESLQPPKHTCTVEKGDSLWKIADKMWGKGADYPKIIAANPDRLKDEKSVIHPGDVLVIPD